MLYLILIIKLFIFYVCIYINFFLILKNEITDLYAASILYIESVLYDNIYSNERHNYDFIFIIKYGFMSSLYCLNINYINIT